MDCSHRSTRPHDQSRRSVTTDSRSVLEPWGNPAPGTRRSVHAAARVRRALLTRRQYGRRGTAVGRRSDAKGAGPLRRYLSSGSVVFRLEAATGVSLGHLALVCGECGQDLLLLRLGDFEDVKRSSEFSRDFVELGGRDLQFAMGFFQDRKSTRLKLQSRGHLVCRLLLEKNKNKRIKLEIAKKKNKARNYAIISFI